MATGTAPRARRQERDETAVAGLCGVCAAGCGVEIVLEEGRIVRLRPRQGHPRGIVCTRGTRAAEVVYSPDRLLYPQRRVGERGEGRFERVSWDDAYELLVERLRAIAAEHGPEALAVYTGRGNFEVGLNDTSYFSQGHYRLYFGLGPHTRASKVTVRWSDGRTREFTDVEADRLVTIEYPRSPEQESQ